MSEFVELQKLPTHTQKMAHKHDGDIEIGVSEVLKRHVTRHLKTDEPISQRRLDYEHSRPKILREMAAEALGVFFYGT